MSIAVIAKSSLGLWDQAILWSRRAIEANRNYPHSYFWLAAALAHLGRLDEARSAVTTGLALNPAFTVSRARAAWTAMSDNPAASRRDRVRSRRHAQGRQPPNNDRCASRRARRDARHRRRRHSRPMGVGGASGSASGARAYAAQRNDAFPPTECRPLAAIRDGRFTSIRDVAQTSQMRKEGPSAEAQRMG